MIKTIVLMIELVFTIATLFLVFSMTANAMSSYQQVEDASYGAISQMQQKNADMYGSAPTGYMPAAASDILSSLTNFRI
jgi:hypothetical protein